MAIDGISGSGSSSSLSGSRVSIAENFDTFLQLLTTQLKNQNPLDPLDTNQFTSQLVQFTSVEQQLKSNEFLEALMLSNQAAGATDAVNFIGKAVTASGAKADLVDGTVSWNFSLDQTASDARIAIKNAAGVTVYSEVGSLAAGSGKFEWDGVGTDGAKSPDGAYTITIDARNLNGETVPVSTEITGTVTGVDFQGLEPVLLIGTSRLPLSTITSVVAA
jgi:flagellar basal-body rod modification protein FlgD